MTTVHALAGAVARRTFLKNSALAGMAAALPAINFAQTAERQFNPRPGLWRTFEVTTRVDIAQPQGVTRVWLPLPSVNSDWQKSLESSFSSNGKTELTSDDRYGARMLYAEFAADEARPYVELTSRIQTQNRAQNWAQAPVAAEDAATLKYWMQPTSLLPTDGIVRTTAQEAIRGASTDAEKAQKLFDWIVANTFREPKVRGCGEGDIKTMLETGNLGGKCADLNSLFVGLCRSVGLPARDVYGIRLAPSAFGYKELGGNSASLKGAQHCRAEVYLKGYGWVGMDPADVAKVMRMETPEWIKTPKNTIVAPVNKALFGGWEGNWMAYNSAHDVALPHTAGARLGFLMYPTAENADGRLDSYAPDDFKYQISAKEIKV
ncbi:MAG: transglutaminase [Burkholderiales bacterium RIFCSPLOWO2_12_FULL_61_40]|nr:MAG: transglutaminase [Burkholderiales bacterium RIFCSPLOWO2_12_FULL_61_40]